jgi:hypothetical protein
MLRILSLSLFTNFDAYLIAETRRFTSNPPKPNDKIATKLQASQ